MRAPDALSQFTNFYVKPEDLAISCTKRLR